MSDESQSVDALRLVLNNLGDSLTEASLSNRETNIKLWNRYAEEWSSTNPPDWLARMSGERHKLGAFARNARRMAETHPRYAGDSRETDAPLEVLGEEWSDHASLAKTLARFVVTQVAPNSRVLELGCGGGRISKRIAPLCAAGIILVTLRGEIFGHLTQHTQQAV